MLVLVGIPLFILELAIGQYTQEGPLQVWENLFPVLKGHKLIHLLLFSNAYLIISGVAIL